MLTFVSMTAVALTVAAPAPESMSLGEVIQAIADGDASEALIQQVVAAGKPGLWALAGAAKKAEGERRARLYESIGYFSLVDAEWTLLTELKTAEPTTRGGIIRALGHLRVANDYHHIYEAAESPHAGVRAAASDALAMIHPDAEALDKLLTSANPGARGVGLSYLAKAGKREMLDRAILPALRDPVPEIQLQGVALALKQGEGTYAKPLVELAITSEQRVALAAVEAVASLRREASTHDLAFVVSAPSTSDAAWTRAAEILRERGGPALVSLLEASERAPESRARAIATMAAENLRAEQLLDIADLVGDRAEHRARIARATLLAAGEAGLEAAYMRLVTARGVVRGALLTFLRENGAETTAKRLVVRARSGELVDRVGALELLAEIEHTPALWEIMPMIADNAHEVRAAAALAVSRIDDVQVVIPLIDLARDPNELVRLRAMAGLERWVGKSFEAEKVARAALVDKSPRVREAAIHALSEATATSVLHALKDHLVLAPPRERVAVATVLARSRLPEATLVLVELAADKDAEVQRIAVEALKR